MASPRAYETAARQLTEAAAAGKPLVPVFRRLCPQVFRQLSIDCKHPTPLSLWGKCVNRDENVGLTIVAPPILETIGEIAGVPMRGRIVHAGLQHTYGYLFSVIDTPYGRKGERWLRRDIERGFGLDLSLLGPRPRAGTLLANVTYFLGRIAFQANPRQLAALKNIESAVAPSLVTHGYALNRDRICEVVELDAGGELSIVTDIVPFPRQAAGARGDSHLLIYSVERARKARLITAFTLNDAAVKGMLTPERFGDGKEIILKYNGYVRGIGSAALLGRRTLESIRTESTAGTRSRRRRSAPGT